MKHAIFALLFVALTSTAQAQHRVADGESFILTMHVLGNEVSFSVSEKDLDDSPEWLNQDAAPPLGIPEAIRISKQVLGHYGVDNQETWHVSSVTIHRFQEQSRWFYVVEWRPRQETLGDGLNIPVLMNGRAVAGEIKHDQKDQKRAPRD